MKMYFGQMARMMMLLVLACGLHASPPISPAVPDGYVPCKIYQRERIEFPVRALNEGVLQGEAVLMLDVDHMGQLADMLVIAHTRREFADSSVDAVKRWRFAPASIAGEPIGSMITLVVKFQVTGVLAHVSPIGSSRTDPGLGEQFVYRPFGIGNLDQVPAALARVGPIYPREWIAEGRAGTVTVDFFIDEKGQVRFPSVATQADEYLGAAAIAAVKEWRFEPPMYKGRPVLARAQQVFNFRPEAPASKS